jgi:hypothetical protein
MMPAWNVLFQMLAPSLIGAFNTLASEKGKPWWQVVIDLANHITPGMPNAPALGPNVPTVNFNSDAPKA